MIKLLNNLKFHYQKLNNKFFKKKYNSQINLNFTKNKHLI